MVTKRDDDRPTDNRQGEYRAICHGKVGRQSFAILRLFKFEGIITMVSRSGGGATPPSMMALLTPYWCSIFILYYTFGHF